MSSKLLKLVALVACLVAAVPFESPENPSLILKRQDEAVIVDAPVTPLDTIQPENVDPLIEANEVNTQMIGDLATKGATTPVGTSIMNILLGKEKGEVGFNGYSAPGPLQSKACRADECCVWSHVSQALTDAFRGRRGQCNNLARAAVRLGFHDAGTWSRKSAAEGKDFGGADGSLILSGAELSRPENRGLEDTSRLMQKLQSRFGVGMADLIQFGAIHAVVTCPLGPRIRFFAGRKDSSQPAIGGLLPPVTGKADELIALFRDKTIEPHELTALLGAHSTSTQDFVDPSKAGRPQDSTPGIWDVKYFNETINAEPKKIFRFDSDVALAAHPSIVPEWKKFIDPVKGQDHWNSDYAVAYTRLSLLGVNNINDLKECSKVLPPEIRSFKAPRE